MEKPLRETYGVPVYVRNYETGEIYRPILKDGKLYWKKDIELIKQFNDNWKTRFLNKL